ncbi:hypothetical protein HZZ02_00920 [Streptococcus danieliae]|nr:hypothetical protein [Streptococcus danieliae]
MTTCGNAGGLKLDATVLPFILRGIRLIGIDSVTIDFEKRTKIWSLLAQEWRLGGEEFVQVIGLEEITETAQKLKAGQHLGRTIVAIS